MSAIRRRRRYGAPWLDLPFKYAVGMLSVAGVHGSAKPRFGDAGEFASAYARATSARISSPTLLARVIAKLERRIWLLVPPSMRSLRLDKTLKGTLPMNCHEALWRGDAPTLHVQKRLEMMAKSL